MRVGQHELFKSNQLGTKNSGFLVDIGGKFPPREGYDPRRVSVSNLCMEVGQIRDKQGGHIVHIAGPNFHVQDHLFGSGGIQVKDLDPRLMSNRFKPSITLDQPKKHVRRLFASL